MEDSALIFAVEYDGNGGSNGIEPSRLAAENEKPSWIHIDASHSDAQQLIHKVAPEIDEYSMQSLLDMDARPRTLRLEHGVLIILRGINHNAGEDAEDMVAVRFWINQDRIVSLRYRRSKSVMTIAEALSKGKGPKTIGDTLAQICTTMFEYIENTIAEMYDRIDQLESDVLEGPDRQLRKDIADVRKSAILLRRYLAPQKEAIQQLRYSELDWLSSKNIRRMQEAQDSLVRNIEDLDAIRERAQVVKDELVNALSDKLNQNLYLLSVITAIFLPLGFLTGLFGINIGGMPGVESEYAFALFSFFLFVLVIIQIALFKSLKWF